MLNTVNKIFRQKNKHRPHFARDFGFSAPERFVPINEAEFMHKMGIVRPACLIVASVGHNEWTEKHVTLVQQL